MMLHRIHTAYLSKSCRAVPSGACVYAEVRCVKGVGPFWSIQARPHTVSVPLIHVVCLTLRTIVLCVGALLCAPQSILVAWLRRFFLFSVCTWRPEHLPATLNCDMLRQWEKVRVVVYCMLEMCLQACVPEAGVTHQPMVQLVLPCWHSGLCCSQPTVSCGTLPRWDRRHSEAP